ncbi:MAG: DUF998 domain-containing protein [Chloroflexota bacterium]|nr:DUF998 domain-containing protein [Chloroflexota bacterium]
MATGTLFLACAIGISRILRPDRGTWESRLLGVFSLGLIAAGLFSPDPSLGFPPGTPQGVPSGAQSWHSQLQGVAFDVGFVALIVACFLFARSFAVLREWRWAVYCLVVGVAIPAHHAWLCRHGQHRRAFLPGGGHRHRMAGFDSGPAVGGRVTHVLRTPRTMKMAPRRLLCSSLMNATFTPDGSE